MNPNFDQKKDAAKKPAAPTPIGKQAKDTAQNIKTDPKAGKKSQMDSVANAPQDQHI